MPRALFPARTAGSRRARTHRPLIDAPPSAPTSGLPIAATIALLIDQSEDRSATSDQDCLLRTELDAALAAHREGLLWDARQHLQRALDLWWELSQAQMSETGVAADNHRDQLGGSGDSEPTRPRDPSRQTPPPATEQPEVRLTAREIEVLSHAAAGRTNRQIARHLFISEHTVSIHISRVLAKLGVVNRTAAAAEAHRLGLLEVPQGSARDRPGQPR